MTYQKYSYMYHLDEFSKEIAYLQNILINDITEQVVKVYDRRTQKITFHTLGIKGFKADTTWSLFFHRENGEIIEVINENLLFGALDKIRLVLEQEDKLLVVRGADRDCRCNGMQGDMTRGVSITKLSTFETFGVLDESTIEDIASLKEQQEHCDRLLSNQQGIQQNTKNMKIVWKYTLSMEAIQELILPIHSQILSVAVIKNSAYVWVAVNLEHLQQTEKVTILTVPTGVHYPSTAKFIGTVFYHDGEIVQHIFVERNDSQLMYNKV